MKEHDETWKQQWFRRAQIIWIIVFSLAVAWEFSSLRHNTASVHELQRTNCGLRKFLTQAEVSRIKNAYHETGSKQKIDIQAAQAYDTLAKSFGAVGAKCTIPVIPPLPPLK